MQVAKNNLEVLLNGKILILSTFLLILPIDILQVGKEQSGFPLCLVLLPFGVLFFFSQNAKWDKFYFWLTFVTCLISILFISIAYNTFTYKSSLSLVYFLLPTLGYFIALGLVNKASDFTLFLKTTVILTGILSVSLFYSIFILNNGTVRYEGTLEGDFFGLFLSGAYGVHSLGAHYFILINFIVIYLEIVKKRILFMTILSFFSIILLSLIIILSLSRELVLAMIIFIISYFLIKYSVIKTLVYLVIIIMLIFTFGSKLISTIIEAWEYKLYLSTSSTSLNELSSGRIDLQVLAISQILSNPLFSTGFNGYTLNIASYKDFDNLEGWSTHIYLLTCLWKMGLVAFIAYILFWKNILKQMFSNNKNFFSKSLKKLLVLFVINILFINLFWDALLAPNIMALFSFFCGCIVNMNKNNQNLDLS